MIQKPKSYFGFCQGNEGDGNFLVGLQKYIISAALYSKCFLVLVNDTNIITVFHDGLGDQCE